MDIVACGEQEPSAPELAAIEAEWPQIEADLAVLEAEIAEVLAESLTDALDEECVGVTPLHLDWRSRRRAAARLRLLVEAPRVGQRPAARVLGAAA